MTLTRDRSEIVFQCDAASCPEFLETGTKDLSEARQQLEEAGWDSINAEGEWLHNCPSCKINVDIGM
jgi:hypothetical protein